MDSSLVQLQECVDALEQQASGPLTDGAPGVAQLFELLERLLLQGAKSKATFLGDRKGYWPYLSACLQETSGVIRRVQEATENKTAIGRGRAFLRISLATKTLAEHIQVCHNNEKITRQYYHRDSYLRNPRLAARFLDILYNLNVVDFDFPTVCLDHGWPDLPMKAFSSASSSTPRRLRTQDDDTASLGSNLVFGTPGGLDNRSLISDVNSMLSSEEISNLRVEHDQMERERADALREKQEAEEAWNELVDSLKAKNYQLKMELADAEARLAEMSQRLQSSRALLQESDTDGPVEEDRRATTPVSGDASPIPSETDDSKGGVSAEQVAKMDLEFNEKLAAVIQAKREIDAEYAALKTQLDSLQEESAAKVSSLQRQVAELETALQQRQDELAVQEQQHAKDLTQSQLDLDELRSEKNSEIESLRSQHAADQQSINDLTVNLRASENARVAVTARLEIAEQNLDEERKRSDAAQSQCNAMEKACKRLTDDKLQLWGRVEELQGLLGRYTKTVAARWIPDEEAIECADCHSKFSFMLRKHHCRMCGEVFCAACTPRMAFLSGSKNAERVCNACFETVRIVAERPSQAMEGSTLGMRTSDAGPRPSDQLTPPDTAVNAGDAD
eukprot:m.115213 g.115213  ORF g.115213 m.115213 type:complete len:619 (-) comp9470_c2_seq1:2623-4479(-)